MQNYRDFLASKMVIAKKTGISIDAGEISAVLKPHQRDAVQWAAAGGRRAIFAAFGLGKTIMQLEWCRLIHAKKGGKMLIVCPLGVKQEFMRDAETLLHMNAPVYVRNMEEVNAAPGWLMITNYERVRDGDICPDAFTGTSLDEAAVLRSFGSKTYQTFLAKFRGVPYKLVSTATPSPNKYKELIHYAGYLEIMDTGQALTRFFKRDSTKANNLTLYPHKEKEFWLWLSTWALFIQKPSNLGYNDTGYDLPELEVRYHKLGRPPDISEEKDGQLKMFHDAAQGSLRRRGKSGTASPHAWQRQRRLSMPPPMTTLSSGTTSRMSERQSNRHCRRRGKSTDRRTWTCVSGTRSTSPTANSASLRRKRSCQGAGAISNGIVTA